MTIKQRYQNPVANDTVRLRLLTYNANLPQSLYSINEVDIYYFDPYSVTTDNPEGKILVQAISGSNVVTAGTGDYYLDLELTSPRYVIGRYTDIWKVNFEQNLPEVSVAKEFQVFPSLWYTSEIPIVYDFSFSYQPNYITQGSKKWLIIEIIPNVPKASDLESYYDNLAISSTMTISIAKRCGSCVTEEDLLTIIDNETVEQREKVFGYYFLDTTEMDEGTYDVTFTLQFGGSTYVSPRQQLVIAC